MGTLSKTLLGTQLGLKPNNLHPSLTSLFHARCPSAVFPEPCQKADQQVSIEDSFHLGKGQRPGEGEKGGGRGRVAEGERRVEWGKEERENANVQG